MKSSERPQGELIASLGFFLYSISRWFRLLTLGPLQDGLLQLGRNFNLEQYGDSNP